MTGLDDLTEFVANHRPHGTLTGDATEPTPKGYMVEINCSRERSAYANCSFLAKLRSRAQWDNIPLPSNPLLRR